MLLRNNSLIEKIIEKLKNLLYQSKILFLYSRIPFNIKYLFLNAKTPKSINLSLSVRCQAQCIYCPKDRGSRIFPKDMSFQTAKIIIDQQKNKNYKGRWLISENGDPFLNNEWYKITKYLRDAFAENELIIFTNMGLVNINVAEKILSLRPKAIIFNMDGATADTYEYVKKGLDFIEVKNNIINFIKLRNSINSECRIIVYIISAYRYLKTFKKDTSGFIDDTEDIVSILKPYIKSGDNIVRKCTIGLWHLRESLNLRKDNICSQIIRILCELFVAPNGAVYPCCSMYNADIDIGNINYEKIDQIWHGKKREKFLKHLFNKNYSEIGKPCSICVY